MSLPSTMKAMVTMGHGDLDQMVFHEDWPRPEPAADEVLIRVGACGLNNTDVNTRSGWYSKAVTEATTGGAFEEVGQEDPTWGGSPISFPRIQGGDLCGIVETVGSGVSFRPGQRVTCPINQPRPSADNPVGFVAIGSEYNGAFAQYCVVAEHDLYDVSAEEAELIAAEGSGQDIGQVKDADTFQRVSHRPPHLPLALWSAGGVRDSWAERQGSQRSPGAPRSSDAPR